MRIAVVDMGTNSTRLLVADVEAGAVEELVRLTGVTRLGDGVDATGRLSGEALARVSTALGRYATEIDELGAARTVVLATSAVRDAENAADLERVVEAALGVGPRVITGEEEARLTFLGATAGRAEGEGTLVIDIGGGSTEFVLGTPGAAPAFQVSTQLGSVRHTERFLRTDPPRREHLEALRAHVARTIEGAVPAATRDAVRRAIAVAGTPTSLAAIEQRLEPYDPARVHGYRIARDDCEQALTALAAVPVEVRRETPGLHPDRAPTIVAGVAILAEAFLVFGLGHVEVSEADILQGAALDECSMDGRRGAPVDSSRR